MDKVNPIKFLLLYYFTYYIRDALYMTWNTWFPPTCSFLNSSHDRRGAQLPWHKGRVPSFLSPAWCHNPDENSLFPSSYKFAQKKEATIALGAGWVISVGTLTWGQGFLKPPSLTVVLIPFLLLLPVAAVFFLNERDTERKTKHIFNIMGNLALWSSLHPQSWRRCKWR